MLEPGFLSTSFGDVFTVRHHSKARSKGTVVVVPPFAEEMNCCRRIVTSFSTRLIRLGYEVFVFDFFGTGDSSGRFEDADAEIWQENFKAILEHAKAEWGLAAVLSIRLGSHIALSQSQLFTGVQHICWQPLLSTRVQFSELCRQASISQRLRKESTILSVDQLFSRLEDGETVDLAGYSITGRLAATLLKLDSNANQQRGSKCLVTRPCKSIPRNWRYDSVKTSKYWQLIDTPFPNQLIDETIAQFH